MYTETAPEATATLRRTENLAGDCYGYDAEIHLDSEPTPQQLRAVYEVPGMDVVEYRKLAVRLGISRGCSPEEAHRSTADAVSKLGHRLKRPLVTWDVRKVAH